MRIAITGGTGFLGSNLVNHLLNKDQIIRILARSKDKPIINVNKIEKVVYGDISDEQVLTELFADCDAVINTVSNFRETKGSVKSYWQTNHEGTQTALKVAHQCGVKRFVHCSTIGVHGDVIDIPTTETSSYNPGDLYQETKMAAEIACHDMMKNSTMEIVIIRPTSQYGPGDLRMLKLFKNLAKGRFLKIGQCEENFHAVYIDDLCQGFWLALTTAKIGGETFLIGGENYLPLKDYLDTAAKALQVPPVKWTVPYWPVHFAAWLVELACKPLKIEPPIHRRRVKFFKNNRAFSIEKAKKMLGYAPQINLLEGMKKTVNWYKQNGYL